MIGEEQEGDKFEKDENKIMDNYMRNCTGPCHKIKKISKQNSEKIIIKKKLNIMDRKNHKIDKTAQSDIDSQGHDKSIDTFGSLIIKMKMINSKTQKDVSFSFSRVKPWL